MQKTGKIATVFLFLFFILYITGCGGVSSENRVDSGSPLPPPVPASTSLEVIDDESFNALGEEDRVYVAKKLYSTIFKGVDYQTLKEQIESGKFVSDFQASLYKKDVAQPDLTQMETYIPYDPSLEAHDYQEDATERYAGNIKQEIYSRLFYTKISRKYFDEWVAYVLTQTILFSPAREVDSVTPFS